MALFDCAHYFPEVMNLRNNWATSVMARKLGKRIKCRCVNGLFDDDLMNFEARH